MSNKMINRIILIATIIAAIITTPASLAKSPNLKKTCKKLGGTWTQYKNEEYGICFLPWSTQKCHKNGASWLEKENKCAFYELELDGLLGCKKRKGQWGYHNGKGPYCYSEQFRINCLKEGGDWKPRGMAQIPGCLHYSHDAGKPCTKKADCEFRCIYQGDIWDRDSNVTGQCSKTDGIFGCWNDVEDGKVYSGCVD